MTAVERPSPRVRAAAMVLGGRPGNARLLAANILVDALGTATFVAGIAFYGSALRGLPVAGSALAMTVGAALGLAGSYPIARLADRHGARSVLIALQAVMAVVSLSLVLDLGAVALGGGVALAMALARAQAPVRGGLAPLYLTREEIVRFKAHVKARSVVAAALGGALASGLIAAGGRALALVPAVNAASYAVCLLLTLRLPSAEPTPTAGGRLVTAFRPSRPLVLVAASLGLLAVAGSLADLVVPFVLAAQPGARSPALLVFATVVALVVGVVAPPVVSRGVTDASSAGPAITLSGALFVSGVLVLAAAMNTAGALSFALLLVTVALGSAGEAAAIVSVWAVEYTVGPDHARTRIIAVFALASGAALAAGPAFVGLLVSTMEEILVASAVAVVTAVSVLGTRAVAALGRAEAGTADRSP